MNRIMVICSLCVIFGFLTGCQESQIQQTQEVDISTISLKFKAKTLDDKNISISAKESKFSFNTDKEIVFLYLFDTSCVECKGAFGYLISLQEKYTEDIHTVSVGYTDQTFDPRLAHELLQVRGNLPLSYAPTNKILIDTLVEHLSIGYKLPLGVLFHNGKIIKYYQGVTPIEMIEADIRYILN